MNIISPKKYFLNIYRNTKDPKPNQNNTNKNKQKTMCKTKGARHSGQSVKYRKIIFLKICRCLRDKFLSGQRLQSRKYLAISLDWEALKGRDPVFLAILINVKPYKEAWQK